VILDVTNPRHRRPPNAAASSSFAARSIVSAITSALLGDVLELQRGLASLVEPLGRLAQQRELGFGHRERGEQVLVAFAGAAQLRDREEDLPLRELHVARSRAARERPALQEVQLSQPLAGGTRRARRQHELARGRARVLVEHARALRRDPGDLLGALGELARAFGRGRVLGRGTELVPQRAQQPVVVARLGRVAAALTSLKERSNAVARLRERAPAALHSTSRPICACILVMRSASIARREAVFSVAGGKGRRCRRSR
jgi:hypothetical protein